MVFEMLENKGRRARFADVLSHTERQAKIAIDPLFDYLQGASVQVGQKGKTTLVKKAKRNTTKSSSFVTSVNTNKHKISAVIPKCKDRPG